MPRQTQSYLRMLFAKRGIAPQHRYGQNFLIDLNIHDLIVKSAEVGPDDVVLEIGPGAGALTTLMANTGATIVAVDVDPAMVSLTSEATAGMPNVRVLLADALSGKNTMNPVLLDNVRSGLAVSGTRRLKLVANLPYNIATPIVSNLLVHPELCPIKMVVTIQLELAERMLAAPQSEPYGALSVLLNALTDSELVRTLPPSVFWPRPKVESAVVSITPSPEKRAAVGDVAWFHTLIRKLFLHRRKNIRRVIHGFYRDKLDKPAVDTLLESLGLTGLVRAEAMNVEEFISLANALKGLIGEPSVETEDSSEEDADIGL